MLLMEIWSGELSELAVFEWLWYPVGNKKKIKFKNYLELIVLIVGLFSQYLPRNFMCLCSHVIYSKQTVPVIM